MRSPRLCGSFSFFSFVRIRRQTRTKVAPGHSRSAIFGVTSDTTCQIGTDAKTSAEGDRYRGCRRCGLPRLCRLCRERPILKAWTVPPATSSHRPERGSLQFRQKSCAAGAEKKLPLNWLRRACCATVNHIGCATVNHIALPPEIA